MFSLGIVVMTQGIKNNLEEQILSENDLLQLIFRHKSGDWGNICSVDKSANDYAVHNDERMLSAYTINGIRIWIITEANRRVTTILHPEEY